MGMLKEKHGTLADEARQAYVEGRMVFAPRLNTSMAPVTRSIQVPGWAEQIEDIEREGWRLDHWTVSSPSDRRPEAYPLFRRV